MNTKEAIEFMKKEINYVTYPAFECHKEKRGVIEVLKLGKKYEAMWEEFDNLYGHFDIIPLGTSYHIYELMEKVKQKYFPELICGNCKTYDSDTLF